MSDQVNLTDYAESEPSDGSNWNEKRLGEIFNSIYSGGTPKRGVDEYYDGEIPFVKIEDLNEQQGEGVSTAEEYITGFAIEDTSVRAFEPGTLLLTIYGSLAETAMVSDKVATNQAILGLWDAPKDNVVFIRYAIDNTQSKLTSLSRQTTQANLGKGIVKKHRIPIPPLEEQRKIASILYNVDQAIQKTEEIIEQTENIRKGLIHHLLTGGVSEQDKSYTHIGPKKVKIPNTWETKQISAISDIKNGNRIVKGHEYSDDLTNYPFIRIVDMENGTVSPKDIKYLKEETAKQMQRGIISSDDVYITVTGRVGDAGTIPPELDGARFTDNAAKLYDLNDVISEYLSLYLRSKFGQDEVHRFTVGSTQPKLSMYRVEKMEVIVPPIDEQKEIVEKVESIDKVRDQNEKTRGSLHSLKRGLMQDLLSGTVRTTDTNIEVLPEVAQHG
jgi:type I restriction enzyme S subunit